jgi:site-specific DNA recombinase
MDKVANKLRYVLYARKSTESDEKQALSIDSQVKEMLQIAERESLDVIEIRRESHSAKDSGQRPVFDEIIKDLRNGRFDGILVWHPDRLSRNAGDLGSLVDLMDQKKLAEIRTYGQKFTNSPSEKFLLMILCSQAKLENDNKSVNVKRGLRMRCEMGLWPAPAPTGYLNEKRIDRKGHVIIDPQRAPVIKQMFEKVAYEKWSGRKIYHWLKFDMNFRSATSNKPLTLSNIYRLLQTPFFYGSFEYPVGSGQWYTGKHEPLITKELFEGVQNQLHIQIRTQGKNKEFTFTKMIRCGACGSSVSAQEKYKNLKDGTIAKYIYYGCTRGIDMNCKERVVEEKVLILQFLKIIDKIDLDKSGIKKKLETEIERHKKFHSGIMGKSDENYSARDADIRNYAKYLLKEGSAQEKRELLTHLKSKLLLYGKNIKQIEFAEVDPV